MALQKLTTNGGGNNSSGAPRRQSLLYVEDEDQNWEIAELSLRDRYLMSRAKSSREAFRMLEERAFDVILMDIQLAGSELNGIEITQVLKGLFPGSLDKLPLYAQKQRTDSPIIFVSAYNARYSKEELISAGGADLIPKPVDFTRLALAISRHLMRQAVVRAGG